MGLGTNVSFSIAYHLQKYGQTERVNRQLEDILRMYVMHQQWKWEEYLLLVKFAYNNAYQLSLRMHSLKALYGWSCNTPINWSDLVKK